MPVIMSFRQAPTHDRCPPLLSFTHDRSVLLHTSCWSTVRADAPLQLFSQVSGVREPYNHDAVGSTCSGRPYKKFPEPKIAIWPICPPVRRVSALHCDVLGETRLRILRLRTSHNTDRRTSLIIPHYLGEDGSATSIQIEQTNLGIEASSTFNGTLSIDMKTRRRRQTLSDMCSDDPPIRYSH